MKHNRTLQRGLGVLFGLVLCLTLLTVSALAAEPVTERADFIHSADTALELLNAAKTGETDSTWDSTNKILTLNGVDFSTTNQIAVQLPGGSTIVLAEGTTNTITRVDSVDSENQHSFSYGIFAEGDLTITGSGQLTVTGGTVTAAENDSMGIYASYSTKIIPGNITIKGGTVTATGGAANKMSYGIYAIGNADISGGNVFAGGGEAGVNSCGISSHNNIEISGGTVTATGGEAGVDSCGIASRYNIEISGGTVTATGGQADESCGIYSVNNNVTISGGHVTARTLTTTAATKSALNKAPNLSGYTVGEDTVYYWRTSTEAPFTASTETPYTHDPAPTYAEFSDGYTYTITLDPNYAGGKPSTVVTGTDGKLSELPAPTRDGYTFEGWFTESGTAAVTTATVFAQDTVLYARWTYGFKFKINGQDVTADNIGSFTSTGSITYNEDTNTLTLNSATITGTALDEYTNSILDCGNAVKTIVLVGENVINGSVAVTEPGHSYDYYYYGIGTEKSLTIQGSSRNDSLTITLPEWTCTNSSAYYDKVTRGISVGATGATDVLTIQDCTLDVVCAGETSQSSDVNAIYAGCMIQIDNAAVNAVAGKKRDGSITEIRSGTAICADGRQLTITDSNITAGAFSDRPSEDTPQDFAALEGGSINLESCTLDLKAEAPNAARPVSALYASYAYNDVVTITDCKGTLHGGDYGIHIDPSSGTTITAYPVFTKSDLTITAFRGESDPGDAVKITGYDSTSGCNPTFTDVIVKAGANESTATLYSNPNSSSVLAFWTFPYLSLTIDRTPPTLTAGSVTRDSEAAATVKFTSNEAGEYYYAVVESGAAEPDIDTTGSGTSCGTAQQTINLTNLSGVGAKDIYIAAKDEKGNVSEKLKIEIPAYVAPIYSISVSPAKLYFSSEKVGYTSATLQSLTITNTGNQGISLTQPAVDAVNNYNVYALSATWLEAGKTASVGIQPKSGLTAGKYEGTLTISGSNGASASVSLFFVVTEVDHSHDYGETWKTDADIHWHECSSCEDRTDIAEHTASDWIVDEPATAVDHGRKHKECTACGYQMESALIPAGTTYPVTVSGSFADTTGEGNYYYDETVNISAGTRSGYTFTGWTSDDVVITNASSADASFTMPGKAVTVTANWKSNSSGGSSGGGGVSTYAITVESAKNGAVTVSPKSASKGSTVTLTVTPADGYALDTLTATDKNGDKVKLTDKGDGKYTFTMPASKVTVKATFTEVEVENPFTDVARSAYYFDAVLWAADKGVTGGTSATTFSPDAACTRAQAVTFLWRAAGSPAPESRVNPFTDVAEGSYYYDAVLWAVEQGITKGTTDTTFSPNATCTRAQIVTFLWRSQKAPAAGAANPFADVAADAYYANAVLWAAENGITGGTTATTFSPSANCTRAQIVTFLYRCLG